MVFVHLRERAVTMSRSVLLSVVLIICSAFSASAAGSQVPGTATPSAPNVEWTKFGEPGSRSGPHRTIFVTATDERFIPASVTVTKGQTVLFRITSRSTLKHEFAIGDAAFHARHEKEMAAMPDMDMKEANAVTIPPGQTRSLMWRFTKAGDFIYACDMPDHADAGMRGTVYVH